MRSVRISHLSLVFILLTSLLAVALALVMLHELDDVTQTIEERERHEATQEVVTALGTLGKIMRRAALDLAEWDETRQQLAYDDYYALWRDSRVYDSGLIPESIDALALYRKDGSILRAPPVGDPIPHQLPEDLANQFLVMGGNGQARVFLAQPVAVEPGGDTIMGYVGVQMRLLEQLRGLSHYRFAELDAARIPDIERRVSALAALKDHLDYHVRPNPSLEHIREVFKGNLIQLLGFVVLILAFASMVLHRFLVRPLLSLSRRISVLQGDPETDGLIPSTHRTEAFYELEQVSHSFDRYRQRLIEAHDRLERSNHDLYEQARRDALTGAFNWRALREDFKRRVIDAGSTMCSLALFDCDHFKAINDTYGHTVGDKVIIAVSELLQACLMADQRLYRLGGDEFACILPDSGEDEVRTLGDAALERVRLHDFKQYGLPEPVCISVGLATIRGGMEHLGLSSLQRQADLAMYTAKRPGSSKIIAFRPEMSAAGSVLATDCIKAVVDALADPSLLVIHYQPIVALPSLELDYAEALVRIHTQGRTFGAAEIFPIVHTRKLDAELDLAVIHAIRVDLEAGGGGPAQGLSINISAQGIVHTMVINALLELRSRLGGRKSVVEITETALITQMRVASEHIRMLREAGYLVALDDFGSGYSSLRYLASMPVDVVKFDISMIRQLEHADPSQRAITVELTRLVRNAGYAIVAEGVETEAQLDDVKRVGFGYAQGYLFGRPWPSQENTDRLAG